MRTVALLPMKLNSSRVKGKNFRLFCGKPLFYWTLGALLAVDDVDLVVINTDARDKLEELGLEEGERVLFRDRRPEICGDDVSMNLVIEDDVDNVSADIFFMTHTTNPLLSSSTIQEALRRFQDAAGRGEADSLFSVDRVQARFYRSDGEAINHDPTRLIPTQDLEPWFQENSVLYVFTKKSFHKTKARIGENPVMFETKKVESIDIDTPDDWEIAELIGRQLISNRSPIL